jgi:type I restriction enzyme, S subunit
MSDLWDMTQLDIIADIVMGQSPDSSSYITDEIGLPFLQGCAEFGIRHPNPDVYCFPPLRIAEIDSILISVRAPVGQMNCSDQKYCIGRGLSSIKAKTGMANTQFLKHALNQNIQFLHQRSQGSTFLAIGSNDLKLFPVPGIPIKAQEKIAKILETTEQTIEKTEALIHKYQQIKAGLMHDLFTRGLTADGKLRPPREQAPELYHEPPIGWISQDWTVKNASDMCYPITKGTTPSYFVSSNGNDSVQSASCTTS